MMTFHPNSSLLERVRMRKLLKVDRIQNETGCSGFGTPPCKQSSLKIPILSFLKRGIKA